MSKNKEENTRYLPLSGRWEKHLEKDKRMKKTRGLNDPIAVFPRYLFS